MDSTFRPFLRAFNKHRHRASSYSRQLRHPPYRRGYDPRTRPCDSVYPTFRTGRGHRNASAAARDFHANPARNHVRISLRRGVNCRITRPDDAQRPARQRGPPAKDQPASEQRGLDCDDIAGRKKSRAICRRFIGRDFVELDDASNGTVQMSIVLILLRLNGLSASSGEGDRGANEDLGDEWSANRRLRFLGKQLPV